MQARANLDAFCQEHLPGIHELEIVDVLGDPKRALADAIFLTPTLIKLSPEPVGKIIGTLKDSAILLQVLGLSPRVKRKETEPAALTDQSNERITALVRRLQETEHHLLELTHGQVDAVVLPEGQSYLLGKAHERLRQSEERFRQLAENISDAFWMRSPDMREVHYVSPAFEKIWGRPVETLYVNPQQWIDFIVPADRERVQAAYVAFMREVPNVDVEYRITRPDGEIRWVRARGFKVRDKAGKVIRLTGIVTDITEHKLSENLLHDKDWQQRQLVQQLATEKARLLEAQAVAKVGSWETDLATNVIIWSEQTFRIFETSPDKFKPTHQGFLEFVHPDDRVMVDDTFVRSIGQPGSFAIEHRILMPDGRIKFVEERWRIFDDEQGQPVRVGGTCMDITERKLAEAALRESEQRFSGAFLYAPIGKALVAPDGRWLKVNRVLSQMVGYSEAELLARTFQDITHPEDINADLEYVRQMLAGEISTYQMEKRYIHKHRHIVSVLLSVSLVRDDQGRPSYFISQIQDITERKRLEQEFRQMQKMEGIGHLASGVAHDFNNILAVIQLQSGLLKVEQKLTNKQLEMAREIEKAAQRAADLTRQLLLFSRKQPLQPRDLDLNEVVMSIAKMLQRVLGEDVDMQLKLPPEKLLINADAGMLDQILLNLTVNARDAMVQGGRLVIETFAADFDEIAAAQSSQAKPGRFICLSVTDTGTGIPPEILPRIFEPFFTTKEAGKGTGLGLATVFGIVQQHQGWINVYSEVGRGTAFRIYLPRLVKTKNQKLNWAPLVSVRGGDETILLVEDDSCLRKAMRKSLSRIGYRVLEATTGPAALEIWKENHDAIRLVLTDMVMPGGMNGKELAEQLLQQEPKLKVIYASGYIADIINNDLRLEENVNFLAKPFVADKLAQTVRNCLDRV